MSLYHMICPGERDGATELPWELLEGEPRHGKRLVPGRVEPDGDPQELLGSYEKEAPS